MGAYPLPVFAAVAAQRLTAPEVARDDEPPAVPAWRRRLPAELATMTNTRPGPADALLLAFVAERGVQIIPPDDTPNNILGERYPRWHVALDVSGVVLSAASEDLRMALLDLWRQYVHLTADYAPTLTEDRT